MTDGVRSLGYASDLTILRRCGSLIEERDGYIAVRTPDAPGYHWGNFILVLDGSDHRDAEFWLDTFSREFPDARHISIGIDTSTAPTSLDGYRDKGLSVSSNIVLTAPSSSLAPVRPSDGNHDVRVIEAEADWASALALRVDCAVDSHEDAPEHREFLLERCRSARALCDRGDGAYFAAFVGSTAVGFLGVVDVTSRRARYQTVETHPNFRRRGVASALLVCAAQFALERLGSQQLVIVADPDGPAISLYRDLGFNDTEHQLQIERAPISTTAGG